ncbi:molybdopterin-dependent oxidoreductase [Streptomonospora wellingtoniae]|uniref:Molybdopterin-dependent oxidoreductase n=1 Tax=Streptomonospora wellingtoniae TaxID=3075544 RepID=A0ABU2KU71_9ACTN|nr:molybdopterin-dependent oxidoreductase [Streptomonospora sp. DSM 45055]MDT0302855.1 molybdopterin-dependent oxidoreductase [Streptomonospora sp. DSM 45055]
MSDHQNTSAAEPADAQRPPARPRPLVGALCGLIAAGAALGTAEIAGALIRPQATPLIAVGQAVIDLTPRSLREFAIAAVGEADRPLLVAGTAVLLALFAAAIGVGALRRAWVGDTGIAALAVIAGAAALTRPEADAVYALPSVAGGAVALVLLRVLVRAAPSRAPSAAGSAQPGGQDAAAAMAPDPDAAGVRDADEVAEPADSDAAVDAGADAPSAAGAPTSPTSPAPGGFDRRRFVLLAGSAAVLSAGSGIGGRWYATAQAGVEASRQAVRLPRPDSPAPPLPDGAELDVDGLSSFFTPNGDFYRVDTALSVPRIDATSWRLRIHGRGASGREYTYADLLERTDLVERDITLACVSNPVGGSYVGNARWIGVPLAALLREAGVRPPGKGGRADQLVSRSSDGMTIGTPVEAVMDGRDAMLALGMNGRPLPADHGFPARVVVPGLYGYVSACKWVEEMELTTFDAFDAYWVPRGWAQRAPIKTQSRIDTPRAGAEVTAGTVPVAGVAWAQNVGVDQVEVRVDDGPWQAARLSAEDTADTWRQWVLEWDADPGEHRISVRASDRSGRTQTAEEARPAPDGATGHHTVDVTVS